MAFLLHLTGKWIPVFKFCSGPPLYSIFKPLPLSYFGSKWISEISKHHSKLEKKVIFCCSKYLAHVRAFVVQVWTPRWCKAGQDCLYGVKCVHRFSQFQKSSYSHLMLIFVWLQIHSLLFIFIMALCQISFSFFSCFCFFPCKKHNWLVLKGIFKIVCVSALCMLITPVKSLPFMKI